MRRLLYMLIFITAILSNLGLAQTTLGSVFDSIKTNTEKPNQSQVVYHESRWWGIFRAAFSPKDWFVYEYGRNGWIQTVSTGITTGSGADAHINEANHKMYVLVSTSAEQVSRLTWSGGIWTLDPGFPVSVTIGSGSNDPASITQGIDGDLFIFYSATGSLYGMHSTDQGATWTSPFVIGVATTALTDARSFRSNGVNYIGLFVGEGSGAKEYSFFRIKDTDDPTINTNWVEETLPVTGSVGDDHVCVIKDTLENLYVVAKTSSGPNFYLFKRNSVDSSWSEYAIEAVAGTRPAVVLDAPKGKLAVLATTSNKIQYSILDIDNLHNIGIGDWTPILENGTDHFNNVTVSYQMLDSTTNVMVVAKNSTQSSVWYNILEIEDIPTYITPSTPAAMSFFWATTESNRIKLEWATYSETNNSEWIVYRSENNSGGFKQISRLPGNGTTNNFTAYQFTDMNVSPNKTYFYQLANVDFSGQIYFQSKIVEINMTPLLTFNLSSNYPNPFNATTLIPYSIPKNTFVKIQIYDVGGKPIAVLVNEQKTAGNHLVQWDADNFATGIYFYRITTRDFVKTRQMQLIK